MRRDQIFFSSTFGSGMGNKIEKGTFKKGAVWLVDSERKKKDAMSGINV